jgi:hypothetical protein
MRIEGLSSLVTAVTWMAQSSVSRIDLIKPIEDTFELSIAGKAKSSEDKKESSNGIKQLTEEEQKQVAELKKRDTEVRAHEAAHMAAGAGIVRGGASFSYQTGPDGKDYAVGGEVSIDTGEGKTPQETIAKMERVRAAALAPANPSGQDLRVAAEAASKAAKARSEVSKSTGVSGYDKMGKAQENPDSNGKKSYIDLFA